MESELLVVSDLHLEHKSKVAYQFILETIKSRIEEKRQKGISPILVCAGDLHNGDKGLAFLEELKCPVVYIAGNHEFWENDYNDVITKITQNAPENVHFLHNDLTVIGNYIFVGATMWTDLGKDLNPDLLPHLTSIMNDTFKITHSQWYESEENIKKINSLYTHNITRYTNDKLWNVFTQKEENEKSIGFYNDFIEVYTHLLKIKEIQKNLKSKLNSKYEYSKISKEVYETLVNNINMYKTDISYQDWVILNQNELGEKYNIEKISFTDNKERIFQKLKINYLNKKLVVLSHHSPFLEERLIGRQEWFDDEINTKYFKDVPDYIYALRKGTEYASHNYFYRVSKGDFSKDESIPQIVHYHNDGSANLSKKLLKYTDLWIHGHEHSYNYEDSLKGVRILTNPLAHSMAVFKFDESGVTLGDPYRRYHQVKEDEENKVLEDLKRSFLRSPDMSLSNEDKEDAVILWALKSFQWEEYLERFKYCEILNKKVFDMLMDNPSWMESINHKNKFSLFVLIDSLNASIDSLLKMEDRLNEGVAIRNDIDFSFNLKYGKCYFPNSITHLFKNTDEPLLKLDHDIISFSEYDYDFWLESTYNNMKVLETLLPNIEDFSKQIDKFKINRVVDVTSKEVENFDIFMEENQKKLTHFEKIEVRNKGREELYKLRLEKQGDFLEKRNKQREKQLNF